MVQLITAEDSITLGTLDLALVLDNEAVWHAEDARDRSITAMIRDLSTAQERGELPKVATLRALLFGASRRNHAELTLDQCTWFAINHGLPLFQACVRLVGAYLAPEEPESGEAKPAKVPAKRKSTGKVS